MRAVALGGDGDLIAVEGDIALNVAGSRLGVGVVPGCSGVHLVVDHNIVVVGGALPAADGGLGNRPEIVHIQSIGGKVKVALYGFATVAVGEDDIVPGNLGHGFGIR